MIAKIWQTFLNSTPFEKFIKNHPIKITAIIYLINKSAFNLIVGPNELLPGSSQISISKNGSSEITIDDANIQIQSRSTATTLTVRNYHRAANSINEQKDNAGARKAPRNQCASHEHVYE